jgi:aldehyde dehydrogenase (NAD+)
LIPCLLELGGKTPIIVDKNADLEFAALKISFGRFMNAGQACVAPDYVIVQETLA